MKIAALDIETIPSQEIPEDAIPKFDPEEVKLGNTKDPVKVAAKIQEARENWDQDLSKKMGTDPALGQICTFVGMVYETSNDEILEETAVHWPDPEDGEYDVAYRGVSFVNSCFSQRIPIVTFNGVGFDIPFLHFAALRQDVPFPYSRLDRLTKKWGSKDHYDLLLSLLYYDRYRMKGKKLNFYLGLFDLGSKMEGIDGSEVYPNWLEGNHAKILEYCRQDVLQTARLFARLEPWIVMK